MNRTKDLTGQRFGTLTVIEYNSRKTNKCRNSQWLCKCDCGNYLIVRYDNLTSGRTCRCSECREHSGGRKSIFVESGDE